MKKIVQILSIALMLIGVSSSAQVTSTISTGNWNTAGNWSNGVPGDGATATINNVMTLNTNLSIKTGTYTVTDLGEIVDPAGGADYNIDVRNSGIFDVSGNVLIGGDLLVRNSAQFVVRGCDTMTVQGNVSFSQTSTVVIESCAVLFIEGDMNISNSNGTTINGNVIVEGDFTSSNSASVIGTGNLKVNGITVINNPSTVFGSTTGSTDSTYGPGGALPIELLSFNASQLSETDIEINWETLTELNNDFFTLEYSVDGENFINIGEIKGAGNSQTLKKYRHIFEYDLKDVVYLRLSQTDYDGKFETFEIIPLSPQNSSAQRNIGLKISAFPNPAESGNVQLNLNVIGFSEGNTSIAIYSINGSLIFQKKYHHEELRNRIEISSENVKSLEKGIYYIAIINENQKTTEKLVVI